MSYPHPRDTEQQLNTALEALGVDMKALCVWWDGNDPEPDERPVLRVLRDGDLSPYTVEDCKNCLQIWHEVAPRRYSAMGYAGGIAATAKLLAGGVLGDAAPPLPRLLIPDLVLLASVITGHPPEDIRRAASVARNRPLVDARCVVAVLANRRGATERQIAKALGYNDRSTVWHAVNRHERAMERPGYNDLFTRMESAAARLTHPVTVESIRAVCRKHGLLRDDSWGLESVGLGETQPAIDDTDPDIAEYADYEQDMRAGSAAFLRALRTAQMEGTRP